MTRRIIFILLTICLSKGLSAQVDNVSIDSVKSLLCHNWGFRAIILSGQEMTNFKETVKYQFNKDFTLQRTKENKTEKGTWSFDPTKTLILIKIKKAIFLFIN